MTVPGNYFLKKWGTSGKVPPEPCIWQMGFLDSQTGTPVLAYDPAPGHRTLCLLVTKAHNSGQSHLCTGCVWSGPGDQSSSSREGEARQSLDWREKHVLECGLQAAGVRRPERCCRVFNTGAPGSSANKCACLGSPTPGGGGGLVAFVPTSWLICYTELGGVYVFVF